MAKKSYTESSAGTSDLESRVAYLESIVKHLEATQPHLMPQPEQPAEHQAGDPVESVFDQGQAQGPDADMGGDQ